VVAVKIEFPKRTNYALYFLHNRALDGQIIHVWRDGHDYAFTFHDERVSLPTGRDWVVVGELTWSVEGDRFVHELLPLRQRGEAELQERARLTRCHRKRRKKMWEQYSLESRLENLM
jgi:hypothetical protein